MIDPEKPVQTILAPSNGWMGPRFVRYTVIQHLIKG